MQPVASARFLGRITLAFAVAGIGAVCSMSLSAPVASAAPLPPTRLGVLVLAPYLTFDDLSPATTPALWRLAASGAVGAMNARTADDDETNAASGALTISAGRWASVEQGLPAAPSDINRLRASNRDESMRPTPGALGSAVRTHGGTTAAVSVGFHAPDGPRAARVPGQLAAMDAAGVVDYTLEELIILHGGPSDRGATRPVPFARASLLAIDRLAAGGGAGLLVIDSPALARAGESPTMTASQTVAAHREAVVELDSAIEVLGRQAPEGTFWLVVAPATTKHPYEDPVMGPVLASGRGLRGELTSSSTRRPGIVTNLDIAPTLLDALGLSQPGVMVGAAVTSRADSGSLAVRLADMARADRSSGAVDRVREAWFIRGFVAFALLTCSLAVWVVRDRRAREGADGLSLASRISLPAVMVLCALPPAAWLMFLVRSRPLTIAEATGAFAVATILVCAVLLGVRRLAFAATADAFRAALGGPIVATALTTAVILADQLLGQPIRSGLLSYSVRSGWRYYGMGNEGAALLVAASIVCVGMIADALGDTRHGRSVRRYALPVVGSVVLVTAAGPFAGANAGVAIWGVVAYAVSWATMNHLRVNAKAIAFTVGAVTLLVVAFAAIDLSSSDSGGTHLARFAAGILGGDLLSTGEMAQRKLANNLGYFVATPYTLLFLGLGGVFALLRRGSTGALRVALMPAPSLRAALLGVFVGGLVAMITEDSSSVMPALMWVVALAPALAVALDLSRSSARDSRIAS